MEIMHYKDDEIEIEFVDEEMEKKIKDAKWKKRQYNRATENWFGTHIGEKTENRPPKEVIDQLLEECLCEKVRMEGWCVYLILNNKQELRVNWGKDEDGSEYDTLTVTKKAEKEPNPWRQKSWLEHPSLYYHDVWD